MEYIPKSLFTHDIDQEINLLGGAVGKITLIRGIINQKFNTDFDFPQIRYRVYKLLKINYGKPGADAYEFVTLAKKLKVGGGAFFGSQTEEGGQFKAAIFISNYMKKYFYYFSDFVLVDATHKRNRLLFFIFIFSHSIIGFISLLSILLELYKKIFAHIFLHFQKKIQIILRKLYHYRLLQILRSLKIFIVSPLNPRMYQKISCFFSLSLPK